MMAWTNLTYAFGSVLTSAKMTQNQDNFTALAQGLSGAPQILDAAISGVGLNKLLPTAIPGSTWPTFSVLLDSAGQGNITGTEKVRWNTELFDSNNDFDSATNYRFTPTVAGIYLLSVLLAWDQTTVGDSLFLYIYKNGAVDVTSTIEARGITYPTQALIWLVQAHGSSDYFEVFASNADRDTSDLLGGPGGQPSFFCGARVG